MRKSRVSVSSAFKKTRVEKAVVIFILNFYLGFLELEEYNFNPNVEHCSAHK